MHQHGGVAKQKKGISSYSMQDPQELFSLLGLTPGSTFVDIGCGAGDYALHAAQMVGNKGKVYAIDLWEELGELISEKAAERCLGNIEYHIGDIYNPPLDLAPRTADHCLMANVLHGTDFGDCGEKLFTELKRIIKPGGILSIIEFGETETSFGPPMEIRLSPDDLIGLSAPYGFTEHCRRDLGTNYLLMLKLG